MSTSRYKLLPRKDLRIKNLKVLVGYTADRKHGRDRGSGAQTTADLDIDKRADRLY